MKNIEYHKVWSAVPDDRVCLRCALMEGSAALIKEPFYLNGKAVSDPPLHQGCRCVLLYEDPMFFEPQLKRDYDALLSFSEQANNSTSFHGAVIGYYASVHFLQKLASASTRELRAAGLNLPKSRNLHTELSAVTENREKFLSQALIRAYNAVVADSQSLKTARGKANRITRFRDSILNDAEIMQLLPPSVIDAVKSINPK